MQSLKTSLALTITSLLLISNAQAITTDELAAQFEVYKKQQARLLDKISQENTGLKQQNQALKSQVEATQSQVKNNTTAVETVADSTSVSSKVGQWFTNTTIGGYGELHYTNRSRENSSHTEQADFHRFVLFFELEQAYIEYDYQ